MNWTIRHLDYFLDHFFEPFFLPLFGSFCEGGGGRPSVVREELDAV